MPEIEILVVSYSRI